ncbi:FtsK/SpoIIIE domain-containing protein [Methylobacterium nodulans]|uniref:Cell divisionFtsK/SpoIIIE n=1 Tax=Methylobacterium nodulans (strain LMG 21967 / CNCM I-2342 / ORS 2060) TaxID=460265 RepID=B8IDU4_METNO|nr:FtsK/SpoIIIE domain-containing protein [Methylobacterium nodulans]ACL55666.1 cell divisionFtsK/SpoIIIE [Methylobacterium nodulans ORS 2060]
MPRGAGGGCIVFATPTRDLDVVGATAGEISAISFEKLATDPDLWIEACSNLADLGGRQRAELRNFVVGLHASGVVVGGLRMLANFFLTLNKNRGDKPLERAIDESLPALRICRCAGRFKEPGQKGRLRTPAKWAEILRDLQKQTDDVVHLVNDRGVELDRKTIKEQIDRLATSGRLEETDAETLRSLVADRAIEPGSEWRPTQEAVVQLSWDKVEPVFKSPKKARRKSLGDETLEFFNANFPRALSKAEKELLETIVSEENGPEEDEKVFFHDHRDEFAEDKKLLKRWESYVFSSSNEHSDLLVGLLSAIRDLVLEADVVPSEPKVFARLANADAQSYWKNKNSEISAYLRDRFRGLDKALAPAGVILDFGLLWEAGRTPGNGSPKTGPSARQFKVDLHLLGAADFQDGRPKPDALKAAHSRQLIWSIPANCMGVAYSANLADIAAAAPMGHLPIGRFARAQRSERIVEEGIDLGNRGSIQDVHGNPDGMLFDTNQPSLNAAALFEQGLVKVSSFLPSDVVEAIRMSLAEFRKYYAEAISAMVSGDGLVSDTLFEQAHRFGALLELLRKTARQDLCRKELWEPILLIGTALSEDRPEVAIITPWHPFRLAEAAAKTRRVVAAVRRILAPNGASEASIRRFATGVAEGLETPWHPAVAVRMDGPTRRLFVETDTSFEFSLLESPNTGEGGNTAFDGYSREAASELMAMAAEYLSLQPHERANFSVSLFNADNRELPSRIAERLARKIETEPDLRCDLILTHTDQQRLRQIYAEQNVAISRELDGAIASEAARSFLSRLRVGFLDAETVAQESEGRSRVDIVFLHDVIARSAKTSWRRVDPVDVTYADFCEPDGEQSTRRRPFETGARKTEVFLVANERPSEVQSYLNLVHDLEQDEQDDQFFSFAPVREIVFDDAGVGQVIEKAHKVGNWVVTFDAIADKQLLLANGVSVIRFVAKPGTRHSVIVSTNKHEHTLTNRLEEILGHIADLPAADASAAAKLFVDEAARISGKVVLHAARSEQNANELVGLVLSQALVAKALQDRSTPVAWLLVDDFADLVGHPPGKRADILVVGLVEEDGRPIVDLVVVESKFVAQSAETQEAKDALAQLKATTDHFRDSLVLDKDALNRQTWLSRLADLIAEQGSFDGPVGGRDAAAWAAALRSDGAILRICGVALVFTHDRRDGWGEAAVGKAEEQREVLFDRSDVAKLIRFVRGETVLPPALVLPPSISGGGAAPTGGFLDEPPQAEPAPQPAPPTGTPTPERPALQAPPTSAPVLGAPGALPGPVIEFLMDHASPKAESDGLEWLAAARKKLRAALRNYGFDAEVLGERLTPNAALVRFKGSDRLTVADVEKKQEVLLTSHSLAVIAVHPAPGEVVVMVARPERAFPDLPDVWLRRKFADTIPEVNASFLLGERESDGNMVYLNLANGFNGQPQHGPHTLIAGETGSGKGVLTRNIILDICSTNSPRNARIRMIDPKSGGDYPWIGSLPHLDGGLVTTQPDATETLKQLVEEMEERYARITQTTSNIDRYNAKLPPEERMPRIYVFHDELGDWMADKDNKDYREAVGSYVARLGMKARAAGIHLFLILQRPDKDALPGPIKANMNNKVCLRVSSATNSRIILEEGGAEMLLGKGHFAAKLANEQPANQKSLIYGQAPFLDDDLAFDLALAIGNYWKGR